MNEFVNVFVSGLIGLVCDNWLYIVGFVLIVLIIAFAKGKLARR